MRSITSVSFKIFVKALEWLVSYFAPYENQSLKRWKNLSSMEMNASNDPTNVWLISKYSSCIVSHLAFVLSNKTALRLWRFLLGSSLPKIENLHLAYLASLVKKFANSSICHVLNLFEIHKITKSWCTNKLIYLTFASFNIITTLHIIQNKRKKVNVSPRKTRTPNFTACFWLSETLSLFKNSNSPGMSRIERFSEDEDT